MAWNSMWTRTKASRHDARDGRAHSRRSGGNVSRSCMPSGRRPLKPMRLQRPLVCLAPSCSTSGCRRTCCRASRSRAPQAALAPRSPCRTWRQNCGHRHAFAAPPRRRSGRPNTGRQTRRATPGSPCSRVEAREATTRSSRRRAAAIAGYPHCPVVGPTSPPPPFPLWSRRCCRKCSGYPDGNPDTSEKRAPSTSAGVARLEIVTLLSGGGGGTRFATTGRSCRAPRQTR